MRFLYVYPAIFLMAFAPLAHAAPAGSAQSGVNPSMGNNENGADGSADAGGTPPDDITNPTPLPYPTPTPNPVAGGQQAPQGGQAGGAVGDNGTGAASDIQPNPQQGGGSADAGGTLPNIINPTPLPYPTPTPNPVAGGQQQAPRGGQAGGAAGDNGTGAASDIQPNPQQGGGSADAGGALPGVIPNPTPLPYPTPTPNPVAGGQQQAPRGSGQASGGAVDGPNPQQGGDIQPNPQYGGNDNPGGDPSGGGIIIDPTIIPVSRTPKWQMTPNDWVDKFGPEMLVNTFQGGGDLTVGGFLPQDPLPNNGSGLPVGQR